MKTTTNVCLAQIARLKNKVKWVREETSAGSTIWPIGRSATQRTTEKNKRLAKLTATRDASKTVASSTGILALENLAVSRLPAMINVRQTPTWERKTYCFRRRPRLRSIGTKVARPSWWSARTACSRWKDAITAALKNSRRNETTYSRPSRSSCRSWKNIRRGWTTTLVTPR